jgi:hypothetical protein
MSTVLVVWGASLFAMLLLLGIAIFRGTRAAGGSALGGGGSFSDFVLEELDEMRSVLAGSLEKVRPHAVGAVTHSVAFLDRGQDLFIKKVFGRLEREKGGTTSFFLKRIIEQKIRSRTKGERGSY